MKLVLIHGRGQGGENPTILRSRWEGALQKGLKAAGFSEPPQREIVFPFYGAKLDQMVGTYLQGKPDNVVVKGEPAQEVEAKFRGELLIELAANAGIARNEMFETEQSVVAKGPLNWAWVHGIMRQLDKSNVVGEFTLSTFTRDVFLYLENHGVQKEIDRIVAEAIPRNEPCVIVAHSLGSVVAYRVLAALAETVKVNAFITVGSPLGLNSIRRALPVPLSKPMGVSAWMNAFDPRDFVALRALDDQTWHAAQPIENFGSVNNCTDNRHGITGYLDDTHIAGWIGQALK